jgi:formiminotetrahydrofolate cyclodeaminase
MRDRPAGSELSKRTVSEYAAALAANSPAPGGGSAVAVAAALAAALGEMVCRFTIGKAAYSDHETEITEALSRLELSRSRLLQLAAADETAYNAYAHASALPRGTDAERAYRKDALTVALRDAAAVPLEVANAAKELLVALEPIARFGNLNLISDVSVATYLAEAALRGAVANVQVNARSMSAAELTALIEESTKLEQTGRRKSIEILAIVDSR